MHQTTSKAPRHTTLPLPSSSRLTTRTVPPPTPVEYFVYLAWTDRRIFSRCDGFISDGSDSTDPCSLYWQPDIVLPDALLGDEEPQIIEDLGLFTHVGLEQGPDPTIAIPNHNRSIAYRQYRERAKFLVVLDQADIPFDDHTLNFTFKLPSGVTADEACFATGPPDGDGRDATIVELSSMQLGGGWKQGDKPHLWSGDASQVRRSPRPAHPVWDIMDFTAHVVQRSRDPIVELESTEWSYEKNPAYRMRELIEGPWLRAHLESGAHSVCEVTFSLTIKRRNTYHILNYIVTQSLLVVLGWCTFGIAPSNVDSRLAITLTLLLAINVFQIVLVENLPEMGNLSRLQWFTVTNTLILALMAMESIIVCQCWKHEKRRQELEARIKELTNNQLAVLAIMRLQRAWRRKKQLDTWRRRAAAAACAHQLPRKGRLSPQGMVIRTSNPPGPSAVAPTQQVEPQAHAEGASAVAALARCSRRSRLDDWCGEAKRGWRRRHARVLTQVALWCDARPSPMIPTATHTRAHTRTHMDTDTRL